MFFQINVTPPPKGKKAAELSTVAQVNSYDLLLAPFQPPTRIKLDTRLNTSVECQLTIRNSNNRDLTVSVSKAPPADRFITLSATEWFLKSESSVTLNIAWDPKEEGSWRDILQLADSRRIKYDIPLILNCTNPNKGTKNKGIRKTKSKPPSVTLGSNVPSSRPPIVKKTRPSSSDIVDKENKSNNVGPNWLLEQAKMKKQRKEQSPPKTLDFSKFLDSSTFKFTPLKSKFGCSDLSLNQNSIQFTPQNDNDKFWLQQQSTIAVETKVHMTLRKETYITVPKILKLGTSMETEDKAQDDKEFDDSLSPKSTEEEKKKPSSGISMLLDDIKFTPFKNPNARDNGRFSPTCFSTVNKSRENKSNTDEFPDKNTTFEIESANDIDHNDTYELPKSPTTSASSQQLKPLCLAKAFDTNNFEFSTPLPMRNRPENTPSDHRARASNQFSRSQIDCGSAKDCLEADLWVKSKNSSLSPMSASILHSTMESIIEEDEHPVRYVAEKRNAAVREGIARSKPVEPMCLEISPPKKRAGSFKPPIRKISPTKYAGRVLKEKSASTGLVNLKKKIQHNKTSDNFVAQISGVKIAKLSLSKLNKVDQDKSSCNKKKQPKEASVKLHDPNDFLTMFCNPDPFAATMTQDPFLANTLYYDDKWIFIQELEFKKWLNALLTPPEHLSADVESQTAIDVGKVWQRCRTKEDVVLAETKESISARYHTDTRLNTLRKAACLMFRKPEVISALSQTTVAIEKEILLIRPDKDLHRDIGLQKIILELLIGYNPLWLRIGLETIYGETIPLYSNSDVVGLSRFLLSRFFSDPFIVKHHSAPNHANIRLPTFQPAMNKFILKKFLFLVFFLDHAKQNKLIGHDPCLFHKRAAIKDSRSVLLTFSREVLSGIGDLTKVLRSHGYAVSHKQVFIDEYDYAVTNLCTDLRDGVRLCRLMELMTGRSGALTPRCRVPAISRLQKVHNVSLALEELKRAGYTICGDIESKCIADGHREKTLSLLWQIIYKFQRPRFERAASTLQRWWRSKLWPLRMRKLLLRRKQEAVKIQTWWRRLSQTRRPVREFQATRRAARILQARWRAKRAAAVERERFVRMKEACVRIQSWWRAKRAVRDYDATKRAALLVQTRWRAKRVGAVERGRYIGTRRACVKIQSWWRAKRAVREYQVIRHATMILQTRWRAKRAAVIESERFTRMKKACLVVQSRWRAKRDGAVERERYIGTRRACVKIQSWWRAKRAARKYQVIRHATVILQTHWRAKRAAVIESERFARMKKACLVVQSRWRAKRVGSVERERYIGTRRACVKIQSWWRAQKAAREYDALKRAATVMQTRWRAKRAAAIETEDFIKLKRACLFVQTHWRAKRAGAIERERFMKMKKACIRIQSWWRMRRAVREFNTVKRAALQIQIRWRAQRAAVIERARFATMREACLKIQIHWRATRAAAVERERFITKKTACVKIQSWWRARRATREFEKMRRATLVLQTRWRAKRIAAIERERFVEMKNASMRIQSWWRMRRAVREFEALKRAAIVLQRRWRAKCAGAIERERYITLQRACVKIQAWWRARHAARKFDALKQAVLIIQTRWRAKRIAAIERERFITMKRGSISIQSWWRMRRAVRQFKTVKQAVTIIQRRWRAKRVADIEIERFVTMKVACIRIQSWWRMRRATREFAATKRAVSVIQTRWRAKQAGEVARQRFVAIKSACLIVQSRWRAKRVGAIDRKRYITTRSSCVKIQSWWRAKRAVREYQVIRHATMILQTRWRAKRAAVIESERFTRMKKACLVVQSRWRAKRVGTVERARYIGTRRACVKIQSWWRAQRASREYNALKRAATIIQTRWRAKRAAVIESERFIRLKKACLVVQSRWRANRVAAIERERFMRTKRACVKIQSWWRTRRALRDFNATKQAVLVIQTRWRAKCAAAIEHERFIQTKRACLLVQSRWRANKIAAIERDRFIRLRRACLKIQARSRARWAAREFQAMRQATLVLQTRWRAKRAADIERERFMKMKEACIQIQAWWRMRRAAREFQALRWAVILVQRSWRWKQIQRRYLVEKQRLAAAKTIQRWWRFVLEEMRAQARLRAVRLIEVWWIVASERRRIRKLQEAEELRLHQAAVKIQALWRGFRVRRSASKKLAVLRSRAEQATKTAVPSATLAFRLQDNIEKFRYASNIGQLSVSLASLDVLVRLLPNACIEVCQLNLVSRLYDILTQANRSLPWLDVCLKDISILLTLAKFKPTTEYVLKDEYIEVLARILTISSDKKEDLFLHAATLMWVLTESQEYAEAVKNCPRTKYALQSLYTSVHKKLGKAPSNAIARCRDDNVLPSPNPDWGLRNRRPRTFKSVSQAVASLASRLNILNISHSADMQRSFNFSM